MVLRTLTSLLTGHHLDKKFPSLHHLYLSIYQKTLPTSTHTYTLPTGGIIEYKPSDLGIGFYLFTKNNFEPETTNTIQQYLEPNQTVIDVGANIGYYTIIAAQKVGPQGKVIAIEPESRNFKLLKQNISTNHLNNITVLKTAISDTPGLTKLYLSNSSGEHSTIIKHPTYRTTQATTLDKIVSQHHLKPNLIKIDIEGAEHLAIKGAQHTLSRYHPTLIFEFSLRDPDPQSSLENLVKLNYTLYQITSPKPKAISIKGIRSYLQRSSSINLLAQ